MDSAAPLVLVAVIVLVGLPVLFVTIARAKGHLRRSREAIDTVRWSGWLTFFGYLAAAPVGLVYAFRLARPYSWWAHRFYGTDRMNSSRRRYCGPDSRFLTAMELKSRLDDRLPRTLWGYDREQVDQFLERAFEVVMALEGDRPDRVALPGDLLVRPEFTRAWGGYNPVAVWTSVEDFGEAVIGHKLLHAPY